MSDDQSLDLDMLAASLQADHSDVRVLLRVLAERLSRSLGERLSVERTGGLIRRGREVRRLTVSLGDDELAAEIDHGRLDCTVGRRSGGIRIRNERVSLDEWLRRLLGALKNEAEHSQESRAALEAMMIGGQESASS